MVTISVENLLRQQREEGYLLPLPEKAVIETPVTTIVPFRAFDEGFPVHEVLGTNIQGIIRDAELGLIETGSRHSLEKPAEGQYRSNSKVSIAKELGKLPMHEQIKYLENMIRAGEKLPVIEFLRTLVDPEDINALSLNGKTIIIAEREQMEQEVLEKLNRERIWQTVPEWYVGNWLAYNYYDTLIHMDDFSDMAYYDIGSAWDIAQLVYECTDTFTPYHNYAIVEDGVLYSYEDCREYAREKHDEDILHMINYGIESADKELHAVGAELLEIVEEDTGFMISL